MFLLCSIFLIVIHVQEKKENFQMANKRLCGWKIAGLFWNRTQGTGHCRVLEDECQKNGEIWRDTG